MIYRWGLAICDQEDSYIEQVRQVADEDAVNMRDALSQQLIETRGKLTQLLMCLFEIMLNYLFSFVIPSY